jgi:alkanesulfonate monooxygenase SsuD/methylene tetrahydromethanopterin reductase-like flavin-dependent oxidoreductase (luciferase family)
VKIGVHLPLMEFAGEGQSVTRVMETVDAARECGLDAISANDHLVFSTPWLDGLTALAAATERSGEMTLATTVALPAVRGPVSVAILRSLLRGEAAPATRFYALPDSELAPRPYREGGIPIWVGSWGSDAGLRRVARLADGWLASAYNTSPEVFAAARASLAENLAAKGREVSGFPNGLATMWTWVSEDATETARVLDEGLAPRLGRDPDELRDRLCIGSAEHCAKVLSEYAQAGCEWVQLWPLGDEPRQIELLAGRVIPEIAA